jgi:hypothetical protein
MKYFSIFSFLFFTCFTTFSQGVYVSFIGKDYIPCELVFEDQSIHHGFVKDFTLPKFIEFRSPLFDFKSLESQFALDKKSFKFKKDSTGTVEKILLTSLKSITLFAEDTVTFEKIKLKTLNHKSEIVDLKREIMVPLLKRDKINIYGISAYHCDFVCDLVAVMAYVKKPDDDYAYIPLDHNRLNLFNASSLSNRFVDTFKEVGKDCSSYVSYLEEAKNKKLTAEEKKQQKAAYTDFRKNKEQKLVTIKDFKKKEKLKNSLDMEYMLLIYTNVIEQYKTKCD